MLSQSRSGATEGAGARSWQQPCQASERVSGDWLAKQKAEMATFDSLCQRAVCRSADARCLSAWLDGRRSATLPPARSPHPRGHDSSMQRAGNDPERGTHARAGCPARWGREGERESWRAGFENTHLAATRSSRQYTRRVMLRVSGLEAPPAARGAGGPRSAMTLGKQNLVHLACTPQPPLV